MQDVNEALNVVRQRYQELTGQAAPEIPPHQYRAFPPGADPVHHAIAEVGYLEQMLDRAARAPSQVAWIPRADTFTADDGLVVRLEIPGVAREDVEVGVAGGEFIVRGERKPPAGRTDLRALALERPYGSFERRFPLPPGSHPEQISARCQDGELEVRIKVDRVRTPKEMKIHVD